MIKNIRYIPTYEEWMREFYTGQPLKVRAREYKEYVDKIKKENEELRNKRIRQTGK